MDGVDEGGVLGPVEGIEELEGIVEDAVVGWVDG